MHYALDMKIFYLRHHQNKTGEGAGGKFNGPSLKTVLKNLDDLEDELARLLVKDVGVAIFVRKGSS